MSPTKQQSVYTVFLGALALLSGCCALAYEILYMRALTTLLGDMFYVHAALLSAFLVGIGVGAKIAHYGYRWLFLFEILTGAYALLLPTALARAAELSWMTTVTASPALTIVATVVFLAVPSLLIGFSIPLFSAYIKAHAADRLAFQSIYKLYNLGALLSVLAVEFVLVRRFGISTSLAAIGGINVLIGLALAGSHAAPPQLEPAPPRRFAPGLVAGLFLASLASAAFQMFFLQLSYLVFYPHRENFAVSLAIVIFGIFVGAWMAARTGLRFATLLVLVPCAIGTIYSLYLPILGLYKATTPWATSSETLLVVHKFAIGSLLALPPMVLFGATLPALMRSEHEVAEESGHLLWVSSMANAAGYLLYVTVGHPWLPVDVLLVVIGATCLLASLLASGFRWSRPQQVLAATAVLLLAAVTWIGEDRQFYLGRWLDSLSDDDEVLVFKSGAESATLLRAKDYEYVSYNGLPSVYVQRNGVVSSGELVSGVIPALAAPRLDRALVLGLGTGITAGATARLFETTDVVEINDAFYQMMPLIHYANLDIADNPGAHLYLSDGRSFLIGKDRTYDAIVNSIPAPTYFSASKIYTLEFYDRVARALKPDGVFCSWLSAFNVSAEGLEIILSALRRHFEYCDLRFMAGSYYMATCANRPIAVRSFDELHAPQPLLEALRAGLPGLDLDEYFADIRVSPNIFERYTPEVAQENTDDHPVLEFKAVRHWQLREGIVDPFLWSAERLNVDPLRGTTSMNPARWARKAEVFYRFSPRGFFTRKFLPLIGTDPALNAAWKQRRAEDRDRPEGPAPIGPH